MLAGVIVFGGAQDLMAQRPESTTLEIGGYSSEIPDFTGNWRRDRSKYPNETYSCGGLMGANGVPLSQCEIPVDELRPHMHPRLLAWIQFAGPSDEYLSPRYDCVADSLPTLLGDVYITQFLSRTPDKLRIYYEQANKIREIWMDGRKHPPMTDIFYWGHSIGWYEDDTFVVDTRNFTFDVDGFDDHTHLATSHLKHLTERYKKTGPDSIELTITIEDPLFLKTPFTYKHFYRRVPESDRPVGVWECDPETSRRELSVMAPDKYEGK
jgi:hypothetical protein